MGSFTRRFALGFVSVTTLGAVTYGGSRVACRFVPRNHPDFFSLLEMVPDEPIARRIGEDAIRAALLPDDFDAIAVALRDRPLIREALGTDCPTSRRTLVQDQCALDFAEGRTLVVGDWVLSETEASLCAARVLGSRLT